MKQEIETIQALAEDHHINIEYSDDDLVIIDNVKDLIAPDSARMAMNIIAACRAGRAQAKMNGRQVELRQNQVLLCPPNVILSDFLISPDFEFKAMFFTNQLLQSFLREKMNVWNDTMYIHRTHILTLDRLGIEFYMHFYSMLRLCIDSSSGNPYRTEVIQALMRSAFVGLCGEMKKMLPEVPALRRQSSAALFQRFLDLLSASQTRHRTVESYASELCVSPKYLSAVCKKNSGKTANEWITEHVLEDIRYYLKQTDLSVKQVCDRMGFPNPSFFGKYVKEHFGMTPVQFRNK